ncbi:hypothetical protein M436DRAFT_86024 [Aureobasidium namibiae CBS 147.97]|uniref:Uncharacterized protein n=1 Tax=Aureobasidium namibiae CBS 147.97 TaxID=1043004 RepID=A0A074WBA1_9PEZI
MHAVLTFVETAILSFATIILGTLILCGFYAMFFKIIFDTRDSLGGDQHIHRGRNSSSYNMAVAGAVHQANIRRETEMRTQQSC